MLNKKNIAKVMAATTLLSTAAPMTTVFADVVANTQTEEIKALKEKVYELLNARYTSNPNLLLLEDTDNDDTKDDSIAGARVYAEVNVAFGDEPAVPFTNYADFEKAFDKEFAKMHNGEKITVSYTSTYGVEVLEDGQIVNAVADTYSLGANLTNNEILAEIGATGCTVDSTDDDKHVYTVDAIGTAISTGNLADGKSYAKIPVTGGYITVQNKDAKLDLSKPKFKVVDGYYVDANNNNIKAYIPSLELVDVDGGNFIEELNDLGGVIEGYYPVLLTEDADRPAQDSDTIAIVKNTEAVQKEDLTVGDLYEAAADRGTVKGNEIASAMFKMLEDEYTNEKVDQDNLRIKLVAYDKAGEIIAAASTESGSKADVTTIEDAMDDLALVVENDNAVKVKLIVESTTDEKADNPKAEWVPVYEATITPARNEKLANLSRATRNNLQIVTAAGMDRYKTAVETSRLGWYGGATNVVLVSGANDKIVDGLAATPLAAQLDAPILLTKADSIPQDTINEIKRLGATRITIVGGESAVSKEVETTLKKTYGLAVTRLAGDGRYETSMAVANFMAAERAKNADNNNTGQDSAKFEQVFVVGGKGEADALSASAIAGKLQSPILLTPAGKLDSEVKHFINKNVVDANSETDVYVVGGTSSVSAAVQTELVKVDVINDAGNTVEVKRLAGDGRQETNAAVIAEFASRKNADDELEMENVVIAKSNNGSLVDALSAGAYAAKTGSHIVLATDKLTESQEDALKAVKKAKTTGTGADAVTAPGSKVQVGYNVGVSVAAFVNRLFNRA